MMRFTRYALLPGALLALATACSDPLDVENVDNPDRSKILAKPSDVDGLVATLYQTINQATLGSATRTQTGLRTMAFENASQLANNCLGPCGTLPRGPIDNSRGNAYLNEHFNDFQIHSQVARAASDAISRARGSGFTVGSPGGDLRMKAFAWFAYGVALGNLALVYDSAGVPNPADAPTVIPDLEGHATVMTTALAALDSAQTYASNPAMTALTATYFEPTANNAQFVRIIRSHKARFRAGVARTPQERAAVDWAKVIADATNGLTADWMINMDPAKNWDVNWLNTGTHFRDSNWHQMTPYIIGFADTSGAYSAWLATARGDRAPILIKTPDLRFPQGETRTDQNADRGGQGTPLGRKYFRNRNAGGDQAGTGWQNSMYDHYRFQAFGVTQNRIGAFPVFTVAENDMLAAEGYLRTGNIAAAATLIDKTRTTAGLPALSGVVTTATQLIPGGRACVPQIPGATTATTCGTIFEAMKWEKRMETAFTSYPGWYIDSRGWGDLPEGTALEFPVPYQELDARILPLYNLGGVGGVAAAGPSTYGFGTGAR
jgi:hypothetical protein